MKIPLPNQPAESQDRDHSFDRCYFLSFGNLYDDLFVHDQKSGH